MFEFILKFYIGGQDLQEELLAVQESIGVLYKGDAVVTGAGKLPCKKVIHASGPELVFK